MVKSSSGKVILIGSTLFDINNPKPPELRLFTFEKQGTVWTAQGGATNAAFPSTHITCAIMERNRREKIVVQGKKITKIYDVASNSWSNGKTLVYFEFFLLQYENPNFILLHNFVQIYR